MVINIPQTGSFVVCFCLKISFRFVFWLLLIFGEPLHLFSFMRFSAVIGLLSTLSVVLAS